jgi:2-polyprenyl-6-methoxyphenol hydroxylase-like FAD-dependent oxidoreductase
MTNAPVLIVGAGPTGLVLALWLTRLGISVRLVDKTAEPGTTSRALAVQARTLEYYRQLGFAEQLVDGGVKIQFANIWARGKRAAQAPLGQIGQGLSPYAFALIFPQDAHERLLVEQLAARGVHVERRTQLLRFDQHDAGVRAVIRRADGVEETCDTPYLCGCDGASSTVREQLAIGFPGGTYTGRFFVADVVAPGPLANNQLHVDLEDADFVLVFPLKGEGRLRLVGVVRDLPEHGERELTFEDVGRRGIDHLGLRVEKVNWFSTYRVHHRVADRFRNRRAFLLGDAGHVHSPVGGQGMNTGIGDAVNLAWKLAAVLKGEASPKLLDTYEPERITFARRLVATTDRAFTLVTRRGQIARLARTRLVPFIVPWMLRIRAIRQRLFRTVMQIDVNYRGSALSKGVVGKLRGGDRLPWVPLASGDDNFEALAAVNWQVHVYGEAGPALASVCTVRGLPLQGFPWEAAMGRAGLKRDAAYLVRPDGYIAWAGVSAEAIRQWSV